MIRGQEKKETEPPCVDLRAGAKPEDSMVRRETRTPPCVHFWIVWISTSIHVLVSELKALVAA